MRSVVENSQFQRKCTDCKCIFPLDFHNFHRSKNRKFGFEYKCKGCEKKRAVIKNIKRRGTQRFKKLTREQKENKYAHYRAYYKTNIGRAKALAYSYKKIDRDKGMDNDITWEFIIKDIFDKECFYCRSKEDLLGCDRLDNSIGHVMSNVVPCCRICNTTRFSQFSPSEMKQIGEIIYKIKQDRKM